MSYDFEKHYINGKWVASDTDALIEVENPATLEHFAKVPDGTVTDVDSAVEAAHEALDAWRDVPMAERIALMTAMLTHFEAMRDEIIDLEVKELGAPVRFTTATHCDYQFVRIRSYIEAAKTLVLQEPYALSTVYREPVGVVACVTPWNYPLGQIVQKVVPAILMGCTVVLKPSQHTPLTAFLLADAFDKAGFPAGVFNLVSGRGSALGDRLATHPLVDMVSFTGSTRVGTMLAQKALQTVKHVSLELGGKSPCVWLKSEDYRPALPKLVSSIFMNSGQTCTSLSRLLVPRDDLATVEGLLVEAVKALKVGDPTDKTMDLGPLSSAAQFEKVRDYIKLGLEEGARMIVGEVPTDMTHGYYVKPVVFSDVSNQMRIAREEIFGPVLCVIPYDDEAEALKIANDTPYGLSACVFGPKDKAIAMARQIHAGNVYINDAPRDVTAPFGGYKESGLGREGGVAGLLEFTQQKAIFDHSTF